MGVSSFLKRNLMATKRKSFPEKSYKEIVNSIGRFHYFLYTKEEVPPGGIFDQIMKLQECNVVLAGTGSTLSMCAIQMLDEPEIIIPKNEQIIIVRHLRYDDSHGEPHFNADDRLIFPVQSGRIMQITRNDAPDHVVKISQAAGLTTLAEAYKLPAEKSGPIEDYFANGAKLHLNLKTIQNTSSHPNLSPQGGKELI